MLYLQLYNSMWQVYPYNHGKLKLVKDLKTAKANLRSSLIEKQEISNMDQIFRQRKNYYRLNKQAQTTPVVYQEPIEEETTAHLSYKQKVDLYRRRAQNEKLEKKYKNMFKKTEKRRHKMRNPVLYKMLEQFQEDYKHEQNSNLNEDIKQSEQNLEMIKINTNRKVKYNPKRVETVEIDRPRFISLQNSLPQKENPSLPNWIDYLEGRTKKPEATFKTVNIGYLQNTFDTIIDGFSPKNKRHRDNSFVRDVHSPRQRQRVSSGMVLNQSQVQQEDRVQTESPFVCERCLNDNEKYQKKKEESRQDMHQSYFLSRKNDAKRNASKNSKFHSKKPIRSEENISILAQRTFTKSQFYSKEVIGTMTNFYTTKQHKRDDYKKMVHYLKNDRPLTSDIRRRNYKVITTDSIQEIDKYRAHSQMQRINIKNSNGLFYMELLKLLQGHLVEDLTLSGHILEKTRHVLDNNYTISPGHLQYIAEPCQKYPPDEVSERILNKIIEFIKRQNK